MKNLPYKVRDLYDQFIERLENDEFEDVEDVVAPGDPAVYVMMTDGFYSSFLSDDGGGSENYLVAYGGSFWSFQEGSFEGCFESIEAAAVVLNDNLSDI